MLQIALCDDQAEELDQIAGLLGEYARLNPELDCAVRTFHSGSGLLECVKAQAGFDLYLLDVMMPGPDGLAIGAAIRERDKNAMIAYLTSSPDYAVASYRVRAMDYLLKPVGQEALFALLDRAVEEIRRAPAPVAVKTRDALEVVPMRDILFVENGNHTARYRLSGGKELTTGTIRSFDETVAPLLAEPCFLRVGASYVVNMLHVERVQNDTLTIRGGERVPIPRLRRSQVRQAFLDFMLEQGRGV